MTDSKDLLYQLDWLVNTMILSHESQYLILSDLSTWLHDYEITDWFNRLHFSLINNNNNNNNLYFLR